MCRGMDETIINSLNISRGIAKFFIREQFAILQTWTRNNNRSRLVDQRYRQAHWEIYFR